MFITPKYLHLQVKFYILYIMLLTCTFDTGYLDNKFDILIKLQYQSKY